MSFRLVNVCLIIAFMLVFAIFCAGCGSSPNPTSMNRSSPDRQIGGDSTLPSQGTPVSAARTLPSLTIPQPENTFTVPQVSSTLITGSELYHNLTALSETLKAVSAEWDPTKFSCNGRSCDAGFVDSSGNTMTVKATLYLTPEAAVTSFNTAKQEASSYRMTDLEAGDEGYVWQHQKFAGAGVLEKNAVILVDYTAKSGLAGTEDVKEMAYSLSEHLSKYS